MKNLLLKEESYKIIGACMEVHNELGCGFFEAVYQEALELEFLNSGIPYVREKELIISYKECRLSAFYRADFICYGKIIVELKALDMMIGIHKAQVINYLTITGFELGLLVNFGTTSLEFERIIHK